MKKNILPLLPFLLLLISFTAKGQENFKKQLGDADYDFLFDKFEKALPSYEALYKYDSTNANISYKLGVCHLHVPNVLIEKTKAIPYLEYASKHITKFYIDGYYKERDAPPEALFYLGSAYRYNHEFGKAINAFKKYLKYLKNDDAYYIEMVKREISSCEIAKTLIKEPMAVEISETDKVSKSAEEMINCPVISADHNVIVYTKGKESGFSPNFEIDAVADADYSLDNIYYSIKVNGNWSEAVNITEDLGANDKTVPSCLNYDGTMLFLIRDDNDNGNVYFSNLNDGKWSKMQKLPKTINSRKWETHASITPDGKTIYFTSEKKEGYGGLDVYTSNLSEKGEWSKPQNLGPNINTGYDEETPYVTENGKKLFFSSQGHNSMGGFDIFYSDKSDNNKWSEPVNMGYPINTVGNDLYYIPVYNGEFAFYPLLYHRGELMSDNSFGMIEVYKPEEQLMVHNVTIKGEISSQDNLEINPKDLDVILLDSNLDTLNVFALENQQFTLQKKLMSGDYIIYFEGEGFNKQMADIKVSGKQPNIEIDLSVEMTPVFTQEEELLVINSIFFGYDKFNLDKQAKEELDKLYELMDKYPAVTIEITGHTDAKGAEGYNIILSEKRSQAAVDHLASKGIDKDRLISKGLGEKQQIAINDNAEGRRYNRRVDIDIITSKPVNVKVNKVNVPEYLKLDYLPSNKPAKESSKLDVENNITSHVYTIQVMTMDKKVDISKLKGLNELKEHQTKDGRYVYAAGSFIGYSVAINELKKIKGLGYSNAFVRSIKDFDNK